MHVFRSMILNAPLARVWATVRAFDGVVRWNPAVTAARMESGGPTSVGGVRHLDITDGTVFRETLLAHSDRDCLYSYDILEGPLPVTNYISTHRFLPVTATGQTLGIWEGWFDCAPDDAEKMDRVVGDGIYIVGMTGLAHFLKEN